MATTFLNKVLADAATRTVAEVRMLRCREDLDGLSFYTLCALADTIGCENPTSYIPATGQTWRLDLDALGNFIAAERVS